MFARTETRFFQNAVWGRAAGILFLAGRLTFLRPDGSAPKLGHNSGGPSALIAYGSRNAAALRESGLRGALVETHRIIGEPKTLFA